MRRILATGSSAVLVVGLAIGVTPTATAADVGSVTVSYSSFSYNITPSALSGGTGDTFTLRNTLTSGNNASNFYVALQNETGSVSLGGTSCSTATDCRVLDVSAGTATGSFTVTGTGTVRVMRFYQTSPATQIGTITLGDGGSGSAVTDPALVYPTATIDANGGTCVGPTQYIKASGQNAAGGTFTTPTSATCTRTSYSLAGWARSATATTSAFEPGSTVPIGLESFTLFAVWRPNGIEIVYDANVGLDTQCLSSNGTNLTTAAERQTTPTVVPASSAAAAQAPCTPPGHTLNGWSLTGAGPLTLVKGAALPASFTGTSQTLYAKWEPDRFDLSVQVDSLIVNSAEPLRIVKICAGVSQLATFTATKNGVAAAGQVIDVEIARTGASSTTQRLTTDASGRVQVNFTLDPNYTPQVVSGSFANQVVRLAFVERDSLQCVAKSITITGERTTVSGKPGIIVKGTTTGFTKGDTVVPYFRFPGETSYTQGSARPEIGDDGPFSWQRKTGKKVYVYFATEDGSLTSNRVIIPAN